MMNEVEPDNDDVYGLMAEFATPHDLLQAAEQAHRAGYVVIDAYSPFPIESLHEALGGKPSKLPWLVFLGGVLGAAAGYGLQYYCAAIAYPLNIGGRPLHSWPAFLVVTFETSVLFAAGAAVFGMFILNGLPMPYHPVFNVPAFGLASRDRFFLVIEARDPLFDLNETALFLQQLGSLQTNVVPP
jgi:hypothetical protein